MSSAKKRRELSKANRTLKEALNCLGGAQSMASMWEAGANRLADEVERLQDELKLARQGAEFSFQQAREASACCDVQNAAVHALGERVKELQDAGDICKMIAKELPKTLGSLNADLLMADVQRAYDLVNKSKLEAKDKALRLAEVNFQRIYDMRDKPDAFPYWRVAEDALAAIKEAQS